MFSIEFDPETAIDSTLDWLDEGQQELTEQLVTGVAGFYYKLADLFDTVNEYFK